MMVTVALEKKIKLWNLMNMKEVYHKNIKKNVDFVRFAPDNNLLLGMMETVAIFSTDTNSVGGVIEHSHKVTEIIVSGNLIITGDDSGRVYIRDYKADGPMSTVAFQAFDKRIKCMNYHTSHKKAILVVISTEGYIAIYDIEDLLDSLVDLDGKMMDLEDDLDPVYRFNIESRLISLGSKLNFLKPGETTKDAQKQVKDKTVVKAIKKQPVANKVTKKEEKIDQVEEDDELEFDFDFVEDEDGGSEEEDFEDDYEIPEEFKKCGMRFLAHNTMGRLRRYKYYLGKY